RRNAWCAGVSGPLPPALARAAALRDDAIEITPRAVDDPEPYKLRTLTAQHGLTITGIASGFLAVEQGLSFTHPDPAVREGAVEAFHRCLEMAGRAGAATVSIGVVRGKLSHGLGHAQAMAHLLACVRAVGRAAQARRLTLVLEPGNRYETDFLHTVEESIAFLEAVNLR